GEIEDEHDSTYLHEEQLDGSTYMFSARLEVDYINENYKLELPENDEYETLGGFIVNETGEIPELDSKIKIDNFLFTILEVSNTKIDLVKLQLLDDD
ncbi:MAG: hemolysin, partial [Maribacter sp.]|nr:hemolysin [Maribacter sp.]